MWADRRMSAYSQKRKFSMPAKEAVYRMAAMSRSSWRRSLCPAICIGKSCG